MMSLSSYLKYEETVINLLKEKLSTNDTVIQVHYKFNKRFTFDLVELVDGDKIQSIYEIKTLGAVQSNHNFIKGLLQEYKKQTRANVFLVFLDESNELRIIPESSIKNVLAQVIRKTNKRFNTNQPIEINSFSEFYKAVKDVCVNSGDESSGLQFFFRGHSSYKFYLIPGIFRNNFFKVETQMYHEAIRRNYEAFKEDISTFDKLVKMQHYELPTRLLDITSNPLVALYFACKEHDDIDGDVFIFPMVKEQIKYYDSVQVCILSNLAKCKDSFSFSKDKDDLLFEIQQEMSNFKKTNLNSYDTKNVYCVLPKLNNERIIRQKGAFFLFGMGKTKTLPAKLKDKPIVIRVKANCKKGILKELQILGIDEAALFPETDKVMKQIKSDAFV